MSRRRSPWHMTALLALAWGIAFTATHWPTTPGNGSLPLPHLDKLVHATIYAVLAITALAAAAAWNFRWSARLLVAVWALLSVIGMFDEATQLLVRGRDASVADWVADSIGALLGIGLYAAGRRSALDRTQATSPGERR